MKHTKGPWIWEVHADYRDLRGEKNALIFRIKEGVIPMGNDAALIAAAPELLAMMDYIHATFTQWPDAKMSDGFREEISKVIAKAKGE
jgi:hypothetical protein